MADHPFGELSAQRRHLGTALRRLRTDAGITGAQMAHRLGISQSRVSRIELGQQAASVALVQDWLHAAVASDEQRAELTELAENAATEATAWRRAMSRGLVRLQHDSRDLETSAGTILNFQPVRIPGLLQVPEYARRVFAWAHPQSQTDIASAVAVRTDRQALLYDESKHLEFVLAEAALRWRIGPTSLMLAQLDRIAAAGAAGNVLIGVIPQEAEVNEWHDHGFNVLDDRDADTDPLVHVETLTSGVTVTDPDDVARYKDVFTRLRKHALLGADATALVRRVAADLHGESPSA